jgi:O-antigen/teichoic acid export membrane protein
MRWTRTATDLALATMAEVLQKLAGYVVLAILARHFDQSDMGRLFFAFTLATLVAAVTELGTGRYLVREVATRPESGLDRLGEVLALRAPLLLGGFLALNAAVLIGRPALAPVVLPASSAVLVGDLYYAFGAFLVGRRAVGLRLATGLSGPLLLVLLVLGAVTGGATLPQVLACYVVSTLVTLTAGAVVVWRRFGPIRLAGTRAGARNAARASLPFFVLNALGIAHFKVDTLLLFALATPAAVAVYETGYKLFEVSRLVVRPTAMVLFPVSAALASRGDWAAFRRVLRRLFLISGALGFAITAVVLAAGGLLVGLAWGDRYAETVPVLRVLYLAVPAMYLAFIATFLAGSLHLEAAAAKVLAVCLAANVGLNLVAIPRWGPVGAAWTTVVTEVLASAWLLALVLRALRARVAGSTPEPVTLPPVELSVDG